MGKMQFTYCSTACYIKIMENCGNNLSVEDAVNVFQYIHIVEYYAAIRKTKHLFEYKYGVTSKNTVKWKQQGADQCCSVLPFL